VYPRRILGCVGVLEGEEERVRKENRERKEKVK